MSGEVVLSAALRSNLLSLQRTQSSIDKVQNVLATGLKVSSALDNPQSFFASQALKNRSSDLGRLLDGIGQSIQTIKAADAGVSGLTKLVEQADSIVASAREAITDGGKEAAVTGNVSLEGVTNLANVNGIGAGDILRLTYRKTDGTIADLRAGTTLTAAEITVSANDSIEQLITKINDLINISTNDAVFKAELTSAGYLKITALDGGDMNITFDADSSDFEATAQDSAMAAALGFGQIAKVNNFNANASNSVYTEVSVTSLANTKLISGSFFETGGSANGYSEASDLLTTIVDTSGGSTARFASGTSSAGVQAALTFTINGTKTSTAINVGGTSIQGLVDAINNDTTIGNLVEAAYDETTGKFTIEATDATVQTINVNVNAGAAQNAGRADFDFGVRTLANSITSAEYGETFTLASAASLLSQYENDYNLLRTQIDELVEDAGYRGVNLLNGDDLVTYFNEGRTNKLSTSGSELNASGLGLSSANFSRLDTIESAATEITAGLSTLRSFGGTLANSLSIIQTRESFTKSLIETLDEGSDKLTVADQNEEGAKLLALQTRQQLGVTALSLAAQAQQSVLRLF